MGDNALQNKPPCGMAGSKKGRRIYRNAPYAQLTTSAATMVAALL